MATALSSVDAAGIQPTPQPKRNPFRDLEPVQFAGGLWWLCVNGDPERVFNGEYGNRAAAMNARDWLMKQWSTFHPGVDG